MFRRQNGRDYYIIPGGRLEADETPEQACTRELLEECSIHVQPVRKIGVFAHDNGVRIAINNIFLCHYLSGNIALGGEELEKNSPENYFEPRWVHKNNLADLPYGPDWMRDLLLAHIK